MADGADAHNLPVTGCDQPLYGAENHAASRPIDNNRTPSYLSTDLGWKRLLARFASISSEKSRIPERRNQNPAARV
jgi:hypothetical protein